MATQNPRWHPDVALDAAVEIQHAALSHYTEWCTQKQIPPGLAVMAATDFIALMILHNYPEETPAKIAEHLRYLEQRIEELRAAEALLREQAPK